MLNLTDFNLNGSNNNVNINKESECGDLLKSISNITSVNSNNTGDNNNKFPTVGLKSFLQNSGLLELLLKPLSSTVAQTDLNSSNDSLGLTSSKNDLEINKTVTSANNFTSNLNVDSSLSNLLNLNNTSINSLDPKPFDTDLILNDDFDPKSFVDCENSDELFELKASKIASGDGDSSKIYGNAYLGPNLWDKNDLFQGDKFGVKFEYLDIDEFLNENGLNESDVEFLDQLQKLDNSNNSNTSSNQTSILPTNNSNTSNNQTSLNSPINLNAQTNLQSSMSPSSISSSSALSSPSSPSLSTSSSISTKSRPSPINVDPNSINHMMNNSSSTNSTNLVNSSLSLSNQVIQQNRTNGSIQNPIRSVDQPQINFSNIKLHQNQSENAVGSNNLKQSSNRTSSIGMDWGITSNQQDLLMSDVTDFDPKSKKFNDDELRPQPILKKSKKQFVPNELKDDKYWARRRKNNMAAKRSRDARRMKENQIAIRASYLERENDSLKKQLEDFKRETKVLKTKLARYEAMDPSIEK